MSQQAVFLDISQIGNLMTDQPEKTKDSPATVQDLRNMGIAIDANFVVIRSEAKTESALLRSEMSTGFAKVRDEFAKLRTSAAYSLGVLLLAIITIGISLGGLIISKS
jgi:CTP synthase (UTP-ammonia lyase)